MGNITNKNITKHSTCLEYYIKPLQEQYSYKVNEIDDYSDFVYSHIQNTILKYQDMYLILFQPAKNKEFDRFQREMLAVFGYQVCNLDVPRKDNHIPAINSEYIYNEIKQSPLILFLGFDNGNFCKLVSFLTMSIDIKQNIGNINSVCAIKPYSKELFERLVKSKNKEHVSKKEETDYQVINMCKFQLGKILLFKALQYMFDKEVNYVVIEAEQALLPYYIHHIGFRLGSSPEYDYTDQLYSKKGYNYSILPSLVKKQDQLLKHHLNLKIEPDEDHPLRLANDYVKNIDHVTLYKCYITYSQIKDIIPILKTHLVKNLYGIIHNALTDIFDRPTGSPSLSQSLRNIEGFETLIDFRNGYVKHLQKY